MAFDPNCVTEAIEALVEKVRKIEKTSRAMFSDEDASALASAVGVDANRLRPSDALDADIAELKSMLQTYLEQSPEVLTSEQVARELSGITNELLARATKAARLKAEMLQFKAEADARFRTVDADGVGQVDYATQAKAIVQSIEPIDLPGSAASGVAPLKPHLEGMLESTTRLVSAEVDAVLKKADDALRAESSHMRTTSPEFEQHLYAATLGADTILDGTPVHPVAKKAASELQKIENRYIEMHKKAGVPLHILENYTSRSYWIDKMVAERDAAIELLRGVDFEAMGITAGPMEDPAEILFEHLTTVSGKTISKVMQRSYARTLASGHQFHRKIFFKTPQAEMAFFLRFGEHTPMYYVTEPLQQMARSAVVAQTWGSGGLNNARTLFYTAVKDAINAGQMTRAEAKSLITAFHNRIDAVTGRWDTVSSPKIAAVRETIAALVRSAFLVKTAIFSYTTDMVNILRRSSSMKASSSMVEALTDIPEVHFMSDVGQLLAGFNREDQQFIAQKALEMWRLGHASAIGEAIRRFQIASSPTTVRDVPAALRMARRATNALQSSMMRMNLIQMGHRFTTRLNTMVNLTNIGAVQHLTWQQLRKRVPVLADRLERFGITEKHWDALREAGTTRLGGVIVPNAEALEASNPLVYEVFRAFLDADIGTALSIPGATIRRILTLGQNPNSLLGSIISLSSMFMSWQATFVAHALPEMVREARLASSSRLGMVGRVSASAGALLGAGAVAAQLQQLASLQPLYEWDSGMLWTKALGHSGLAPVIGPISIQLARDISQGREVDVEQLMSEALNFGIAGPSGSYLTTALDTMWDSAVLAVSDEYGRDKYKRQYDIMRNTSRLVPLPAGIVFQGVVDSLIDSWFFDKSPRDRLRYKKKMKQEGRIRGTSPNF